jgi:hypothetical protein
LGAIFGETVDGRFEHPTCAFVGLICGSQNV